MTFYRESQCGHSRSAYFLGKNLAVCFRMMVSSLHFTAFYLVLAAPMIPFNSQLVLGFLYSYCKLVCSKSEIYIYLFIIIIGIYGLGFVVSAVTRREDGPMLCMLLSLIVSALSGCAPRLSTVREWHLEWFWYSWPAVSYAPCIRIIKLELKMNSPIVALDLVLRGILPGKYGPCSLPLQHTSRFYIHWLQDR